MKKINKTRGVALIQVLLISSILSIFAIQVNSEIQRQVEVARSYTQSANAIAAIQTAKADILYALYTQPHLPDHLSNDEIVNKWNFYGEPFIYNKVQVSLRPMTAYFAYMQLDYSKLSQLLTKMDVEQDQISTIVDSLQDWQDKDDLRRYNGAESAEYLANNRRPPRNDIIQFKQEIQAVNGMTEALWERLEPLLSPLSNASFNPYAANENMLTLLYGEAIAKQVMESRMKNDFTPQKFTQLTGITESEYVDFTTGQYLKLTFSAERNGIQSQENMIIRMRPLSATPYSVWTRNSSQ